MASDYGDDDDAWDFDLLEDVLKKAEAANAAKRASQAASQALSTASASAPPQAESYGTSNFTSQVSHSNSVQHGAGGPNFGYRQGDTRPVGPEMGRGYSPTPVRTPSDAVRSPGYNVNQQPGLGSGMGNLQLDRVVAGFASPQPTSVGAVQSRGSHGHSKLANSQSTKLTGHENMPPPAPSPLGRQPLLSQAPSGGIQNLSNSAGDDEKSRLREELAEKTGAVSLLKSRLSQADKEIFELKTRTGRQGIGNTGADQTREFSRISSELQFKDQELLEARRAKSDKEEQLKEALATAAKLQEELEALKRERQNASNEVFKQVEDENRHGRNRNPSVANEVSRHQQREDGAKEGGELRSASVAMEVAKSHSPVKHKNDLQGSASGSGGKAKPSGVAGDASVMGKGKEKVDDYTKEEAYSDVETQRLIEMKHTLEHIWGLNGSNDDCVTIVPKLFAACREELYKLLNESSSEQETKQQKNVVNVGRDLSRKRKGDHVQEHVEPTSSASWKLHSAISEVSNGRASPSTLLGPLKGFCSMNNEELVFSALCVLRHLLILDSSCRNAVLERKSPSNLGSEVSSSSGASQPLEPPISIGRKGWAIMRSTPTVDGNGMETETYSRPVFASPRISFRVEGRAGAVRGEAEQSKTAQVEVSQGNALSDVEISSSKNPFTAWILDLATKSKSERVHTECASIVCLLVAHSEPRTRIQFAFMLFDGSLAGLLRQAVPEIQLFAFKLVQLLLSCRNIYKAFCTSESHDQAEDSEAGDKRDLAGMEDMQLEVVADEKVEGGAAGNDKTEPGISRVDCVVDIVKALACCLKYTGNSLDEYTIRRRALRALTFLAVSGDLGAATLIRYCDVSSEEDSGSAGKSAKSTDSTTSRRPSRKSKESEPEEGPGFLTPAEQESSVSVQLMCMIASELDAEEKEDPRTGPTKEIADERMSLWKEALSLLCRLSANPFISLAILSSLTVTKPVMRLSVSVTQRLISRAYARHVYGSSKERDAYSGIVDLAEILKKRILSSIPPCEEAQPRTTLGTPQEDRIPGIDWGD